MRTVAREFCLKSIRGFRGVCSDVFSSGTWRHCTIVLLCFLSFLFSAAAQISIFIEGSLEVKVPTIWTDEKERWKGSERRERLEERRIEEKESEERRCRCAKR